MSICRYEVREKTGFKKAVEGIVAYVKRRKNECGVVYCLSRNETESVAKALQQALGTLFFAFADALTCFSILYTFNDVIVMNETE